MPTQIYYRIWCKKCNEFELHHYLMEHKTKMCKNCDTSYTDVYIKDIPKEKIIEQRKRYTERRGKDSDIFGKYLLGGIFGMGMNSSLFSEDWPELEIQESDAGQREIDEIEQIKTRNEITKKMEIHHKKVEEAKRFSKLGRNEICLCGSNKKYKKCCWSKYQQINIH